MKHLLWLLFFALPVCAQTKAFTARNNTVIWENVFVTGETDVASILEKHPSLTITSHKGNKYKGVAKNVKNSCPGISESFIDAQYNFSFEIERSAGMYSVTITKMKVISSVKNKTTNIETYLLEKGSIKTDTHTVTDLSCLDALFNRMFTATNILKNKP